ncbi:gluconokinase [Deinococcus sp.]|uniref:gluconokinase n=1 Tax=Deinococcus sp. TaxID=47478 RepID=UPI003CC6787D
MENLRKFLKKSDREPKGAGTGRIQALIVMGVSGSGKTSVGRELAAALGWAFLDADDVHSAEAKAKMARGEGLSDADRWPWLERLRAELEAKVGSGRTTGAVLACSALKRRYRDVLRLEGVYFVYLRLPCALLETRLRARPGHYAGPSLLSSQLAALEEPSPDEGALTLEVGPDDSVQSLTRRTLEALGLP